MAQVFENAVRGRRFTSHEIGMMREAYLKALSALGPMDHESRLRLAQTIFKLKKLERFPGSAELAALAVDWYLAGKTE